MMDDLLTKMKMIIGDSYGPLDEDLLSVYLDAAAEAILNRRYPYGVPEGAVVEHQYEGVQLEAAVYLFNKRGAENESLHSENGISRSYGGETALPREIINRVTPKGRVM